LKKLQVAILACLLALNSMFISCDENNNPTSISKQYFDAMQRGDLRKVKDLLDPKKLNTIEFFTSDGLKETFARINLTIKEEIIDGDSAVVKGILLLKGGKEHTVEFKLVKINRKWKVNIMQL